MASFKRILFPIDLSDASKKIVPRVKEVVGKFDAELHIVYSMNNVAGYIRPSTLVPLLDYSKPMTKMEAEKKTRAFIESQFNNLSVQSKILAGPPGKLILRYAEEEGIDLIIMGCSSKEIAEAAFGSVTGYVTKHSHIPVLIINTGIQV